MTEPVLVNALGVSPAAALLGAVIGAVMSMTGAGGGVLAVPLLIFGLGLPLTEAAPVSMLAVGGAALVGALLGLREGIVRYRAAGLIGGLAMLTAPIGVTLSRVLPQAPLLLAFSGVLFWTAWRMSGLGASAHRETSAPPCQVNPDEGRLRWTSRCALRLAATGATSGLMTGLLGVGGGFVIVPALSHVSDLDAHSIAATSLAVIAMATLAGLLAALGHGQMQTAIALPFGLAALGALLVGRRVAAGLPAQALQRIFATVSVVVAAMVLVRGWRMWMG